MELSQKLPSQLLSSSIYAITSIYDFLPLEKSVELQLLNKRHYEKVLPKMLARESLDSAWRKQYKVIEEIREKYKGIKY